MPLRSKILKDNGTSKVPENSPVAASETLRR
jgi:hypothetical protein